MITTRACSLLGITHPVVLGGMSGGFTNPELVAAVSEAGGLGVLGAAWHDPADIAAQAADIRRRTERPFGLNLLLFGAEPERVDAVIEARPAVLSTAWPSPEPRRPGAVPAHCTSGRCAGRSCWSLRSSPSRRACSATRRRTPGRAA